MLNFIMLASYDKIIKQNCTEVDGNDLYFPLLTFCLLPACTFELEHSRSVQYILYCPRLWLLWNYDIILGQTVAGTNEGFGLLRYPVNQRWK